jgi:membrane-bound metal-dependent hydrolase YbcI (DUF457 family)
MVAALAIWTVAEVIQRQTAPPSSTFLLAHEGGHIALASAWTIWLVPAWGFRTLLVAVSAGTLIDVDHAIAAGSIDPTRMMALGARPPTHSLAGIALLAGVVLSLFGWRAAYAAFAGALSHILVDASAPPGVPLLAPWSTDRHILVPAWSVALGILVIGCIGVLLARPRRARQRSDRD